MMEIKITIHVPSCSSFSLSLCHSLAIVASLFTCIRACPVFIYSFVYSLIMLNPFVQEIMEEAQSQRLFALEQVNLLVHFDGFVSLNCLIMHK